MLYLSTSGLGEHVHAIPPERQIRIFKFLYAYFSSFFIAVSLAKTSVLFFYTRMFTTSNPSFRWSLLIVQLLVIGWLVAALIVTPLLCILLEKLWLPQIPGRCINISKLNLGTAISSTIIDFIILLLPTPHNLASEDGACPKVLHIRSIRLCLWVRSC